MSTTSIPKISPIACDLIPDWRKKTSEIDDVKFSKSIFRRTMLPKAKLRTPLDFPRHSAYDRHFLCKIVALKLDLNPRPGGGVILTTLSSFSQIVQKRRRAAPPFLVHLISHHFHTLSENFKSRSPQVRSPGQVKWSRLQKCLRPRQGYSFRVISMKLRELQKDTHTNKTYVSEFRYRWP